MKEVGLNPLELLKEKMVELANEKETVFEKEITEWVARTVLLQTKYAVDHSNDPPWDQSGEVLHTGECYDVNDYLDLNQFLEEYNGQSSPSYTSGCGMFHDTFEKTVDDWLNEEKWKIFHQAITTLYNESELFSQWAKENVEEKYSNEAELINELENLLYEEEDIINEFMDYEIEGILRGTLFDRSFHKLYQEGKRLFKYSMTKEEKENLLLNQQYKKLLTLIKTNQNKKILTVITQTHGIDTFEMNENGEVISPYRQAKETHDSRLKKVIQQGMQSGGAITIREFTPLKTEINTTKGKQRVSIKKIYGVRLEDSKWVGISSEEMEKAHCTDMETGKRIDKEKGVIYVDFKANERQ